MRPLKIIHVANRAERYKGARSYGLPYRINNGLVRDGHHVCWFSDRDMARYLAPLPTRKLGVGKCNRALLEFCRNSFEGCARRNHVVRGRPIDLCEYKRLRCIGQFQPEALQWFAGPSVRAEDDLQQQPHRQGRRQQTSRHAATGQGRRRGRGQENPRMHYLPGLGPDAGP